MLKKWLLGIGLALLLVGVMSPLAQAGVIVQFGIGVPVRPFHHVHPFIVRPRVFVPAPIIVAPPPGVVVGRPIWVPGRWYWTPWGWQWAPGYWLG